MIAPSHNNAVIQKKQYGPSALVCYTEQRLRSFLTIVAYLDEVIIRTTANSINHNAPSTPSRPPHKQYDVGKWDHPYSVESGEGMGKRRGNEECLSF